jgi:DNA-binding CsgD family transcriptional regulator
MPDRCMDGADGSPEPEQSTSSADIPLLDILEELNLAAALIDDSARMIAMTQHLTKLEAFSDCRIGRQPRHWDQSAEERMRAYLQAIVSGRRALKPDPVPLVIDGTRRRPLVVKAMPIRQRPLNDANAAAAVVIVMDLDSAAAPSPQLLRYVFDFTPSEARLASRLAGGESLGQVAQSLQISFGTARQHLKAIFAKTGSRRQSELLVLLSRLSALRPGDGDPPADAPGKHSSMSRK